MLQKQIIKKITLVAAIAIAGIQTSAQSFQLPKAHKAEH